MTSPIRSTGTRGLRRSNSRTTFTAMSSARVFQKTPFGPARPNAVRTPSTKTTSRGCRGTEASLRRECSALFQLLAEVLELPAVRSEHLTMELDEHDPAGNHE